ncbi:MAG TPA: alanine racemase [Jiangellaceae bacterium]|nr:alanine racemase [Jiangellaceae bacterium]
MSTVTSEPSTGVPHAEVQVDLDAIAHNVATLRARAGGAQLMVVVKGDAYGHGLLPVARTARSAGATWLGTANLAESLALRAAGDRGRLLCWLHTDRDRFADAVETDIDLGVSTATALHEVTRCAHANGRTARVHLKVDTGLNRNGVTPADLDQLLEVATAAQDAGDVVIVGMWSHFARADEPGDQEVSAQLERLRSAVAHARTMGIDPEVCHIANSAATLTRPDTHLDLVRVGLAVYGLSPLVAQPDPGPHGLRPAMTVRALLANVKRVPAGGGVSYGHQYRTAQESTLVLVPMGYADGLPRHASSGPHGPGAPVLVAGERRRVAGTVCMDQFVVDLGPDVDPGDVSIGDTVVLFGDAARGEPTAEDWALASGTISYEIVSRIAPRQPRSYIGDTAGTGRPT